MSHEIDILSQAIQQQQAASPTEVFKTGFEKGLKHYQSHYLWTLIDCLQDHYPTILKALSTDNFNYFARKFILEKGSESENLDDFDKRFISFLTEQKELNSFIALGPLGQIDWLIKSRFDDQKRSLELPLGSLTLWKKIKNDEPLDSFKIFPKDIEVVQLISEEDGYYLMTEGSQ